MSEQTRAGGCLSSSTVHDGIQIVAYHASMVVDISAILHWPASSAAS